MNISTIYYINKIITNLTDFELTTDEVEILNLGLKHGLLRPKEPELIAVIVDVFDQICRHKLFTDHYFAKHQIQTALKSFTYNYLDLDFLQFKLAQKKVKILRNLRERCIILKPDKGQGVVLVKKEDYYHSLECIFGDKSKFQNYTEDPTLRNLATAQNYLNILLARGEIT